MVDRARRRYRAHDRTMSVQNNSRTVEQLREDNNKTVASCEFQTRSWSAINFSLFYRTPENQMANVPKYPPIVVRASCVYLTRDSVGHTSRYISHSRPEESKWEKFLQRNKRRPDLTIPLSCTPPTWSGRRRGINTPQWRDIAREIIKGKKDQLGDEKKGKRERETKRRVGYETLLMTIHTT